MALVALCCLFWAAPSCLGEGYGGGSGTEAAPYLIATVTQLNAIGTHPEDYDKHFILTQDIDLAGQTFSTAIIAPDSGSSSNSYEGTMFSGTFKGDGHVIRNLVIDTNGASNEYLGVFGAIDQGSRVSRLGIENARIVSASGSGPVGSLCGQNSGTLDRCYATGSVSGDWYVGGLCGWNLGTVSGCCATGSATGGWYVGGLCGYNSGTVGVSYATGSAAGVRYVGALCGFSSGAVHMCYATGSTVGSLEVGGLCGLNAGTAENCYFYLFGGPDNGCGSPLDAGELVESSSFIGFDFAGVSSDGGEDSWSIVPGHCPRLSWETGDGPLPPTFVPSTTLAGSGTSSDPFVIASVADFEEFRTNDSLVCGHYSLECDIDLAGELFVASPVDRTFGGTFLGNGHVVRELAIDTGGDSTDYLALFASVSGTIRDLGVEGGAIEAGRLSRYVGALCGYNCGTLSGCYTTGSVTGGTYVGALCGMNSYGTVTGCYATGRVSGIGSVGGLCGLNAGGTVSGCYATGWVLGDGSGVGGLCGGNYSSGTVSQCFATGLVSGVGRVGGLCGWNRAGLVSGCYATGPVTGGDDGVGGFCGESAGTVSGCYATGPVTSEGDGVGGFCGESSGILRECYATGWALSDGVGVGGLCGSNSSGTVSECYATGAASGGDHIGGLCGENSGTVSRCYATGSVSGVGHYVRGLCGTNYGTVSACFWDRETSGVSIGFSGYYGDGWTTDQMRDQSTFANAGWDFVGETLNGADDLWYMNGYPALSCFGVVATYPLLVYNGSGSGSYAEASAVAVRADAAPTGMEFSGWSVSPASSLGGLADARESITVFTVPAEAVTLTATYAAEVPYGGGSGTEADPYQIARKTDLLQLAGNADDYDKYFVLITDIDLSGEVFVGAVIAPDADGSTRSYGGTEFAGTFDGGGHVIRHLTIDTGGASNDYLGLFGAIGPGARVTDLGVEDANVVGGSDSDYVGPLCGKNSGTMARCYATGVATGHNFVGGLSGCNSGAISECYATGVATAHHWYVGGLCGDNSGSGTVVSCYAAGLSSGENRVGGFCGHNSGEITDCYFYLFGGQDNGCGVPLEEGQLVDAGSFVGFDFAGVSSDGDQDSWLISPGRCPRLSWETGLGPLPPTDKLPSTTLAGSGTPSDPFVIGSLGDFAAFRTNPTLVCGHYSLVCDVDLDGMTFSAAPVNRVFGGTFQGNGHIVRNLALHTSWDSTNAELGLFASVCGTILDLGVENASINAPGDSDHVGALCGYSSGTLSGCWATGSVWASGRQVGGLCGYNDGGTLIQCYATSSVTGDSYVGGLCGWNLGGTVRECWAKGSVLGWGDDVGGLCGENAGSGTVVSCYATGAVSGDEYVGGLCGESAGTLSECYATGSATGEWNVGGLCGSSSGGISDCFFHIFGGWNNNLGVPLDAGELGDSSSYTGFDFAGIPSDGEEDRWSITPGHCPRLSWETGDGPLPPTTTPGTTLVGSGTLSDPFAIASIADFEEFRTNEALACGCYSLLCDIDLAGRSFAVAPVNRVFGGTLLGNGHAVRNLTVDTDGASTDYLGLFASVCGAIRDLDVEGGGITGGSGSDYVGGLCGRNGGVLDRCGVTGSVAGNSRVGGLCGGNDGSGMVAACYATGSVAGDSYVGGLCGLNYGALSDCYAMGPTIGGDYVGGLCGYSYGVLGECRTAGTVSGGTSVGGLCGRNRGVVNVCFAAAAVSGGTYVGGLCGYSDETVSVCYATGAVSGTSSVGGLCGYNYGGSIGNCYATGRVSGTSSVGGLCGRSYSGTLWSATVENCFWDTETSGTTISDGGTGQTTAEMQTKSTFTDVGWDFVDETANGADDVWIMDGYPVFSHSLVVEGGDGDGNYAAGAVVTVTADAAPDGQVFAAWIVSPGDWGGNLADASAATTTFTVPAAGVTLTATYVDARTVVFLPGLHGALMGGDPNVTVVVPEGSPVPTVPPVTADEGWTHVGWDWIAAVRGAELTTITENWTATAIYEESVPQPPSWQVALTLVGAEPSTLAVGMRSDATDGWDPGVDEQGSLPGAGSACLVSDDLALPYAADYHGLAETGEFLLMIDASDNENAVVAWDVSGLPEGKYLSIYEVGLGEPVRDGAAVERQPEGNTCLNMALDASLEVPAGESRSYLIRYGDDLVFDLAFEVGWNLVSVPIEPNDPALGTVLGDGLGGTIHSGSVCTWFGQEYVDATELHACTGYWVHVDEAQVILVNGMPVGQTQLDLARGWNQCGVEAECDAPDDVRINGKPWIWNPRILRYEQADVLCPGVGFWINASEDASIGLNGGE